MAKLKFKNFEGCEYEIKLQAPPPEENADGLCFSPNPNKPSKIYIDPNLAPRKFQEILLHEMIHAFFWDLSETKVLYLSKKLSQMLNKTQ